MFQYAHLIGKPFTGIERDDCFALASDFYDVNFGIKVRNYARPSDWDANKLDLIRNFHEKEGFEMITEWKVKDLRPADILAMASSEGNADHLAIFLGDDKILHHLYGRISREEPFHGFWRDKVMYVLRHPDVPDLRPVYPDTNIMELLRARNSVEA